MSQQRIRSVVIVGGGTAGWMTAAYFSRLVASGCQVRVVESDEIASIGVGEATIPTIQLFNRVLGLDENDFLRHTQGTFKLGIEFVNWGRIGEGYMHGFSPIGADLYGINCHQYWLKMNGLGVVKESLDCFSLSAMASRQAKFLLPQPNLATSPLREIAYAYHFDAGLYAQYLRRFAEARGVLRTEGRIVQTHLRAEDGFIESVELANGNRVAADLFIDCSGTRALLIGQALGMPYEDWSHWLPCDRAIAVPCESADPLLPYTRSTAHTAGWQWRIPLQHRIGNGHVYSSRFMSQDEATAILMANLDGKALAEPRYIPFTPGRRQNTWHKNCVAVGLSSGFFEPIESTNIYLIQSAIQRLGSLFPRTGFAQAEIDEYNRQTQYEYERIRDFIILHYKVTQREDSAFWRHCQAMDIPQSLQHRLDLYRSSGRAFREGSELFSEISWIQVMNGQGLVAQSYNPMVDLPGEAEVLQYLRNVQTVIQTCADVMPTHSDFIAQHCAAKPLPN